LQLQVGCRVESIRKDSTQAGSKVKESIEHGGEKIKISKKGKFRNQQDTIKMVNRGKKGNVKEKGGKKTLRFRR